MMKQRCWWIAGLVAMLGTLAFGAEMAAGLPLHIQKLNNQAVRVWVGDYISSTAVTAFSTTKGIVVVDTLGIPALDREVRKVIARELKRNDFKILINTHEHRDHTGGNAVYADCTIVAQALCAEGMAAAAARCGQTMDWYVKRTAEIEKLLPAQTAGSLEANKLREEMIENKLVLESLREFKTAPAPTKTFTDRQTLNMGDTTFELYYTGGVHAASDIAVFVPQQGILLTGDTMADKWLTDSPGCLAAFRVRTNLRHNFPLLLHNWALLLARKDQIRLILPGHWNGELSYQGFEDRYNYTKALWEGINQAVEDGRDLQALFAEFSLDKRFPKLVNSPGFSVQNNNSSIAEIWADITKTESAGMRCFNLLKDGASEAAARQVMADFGKKPAKYYFLETVFNANAYQLMELKKFNEAIVLLKLALEVYPKSWNLYDSLGEASMKSGDNAAAIKFYEKSLELNPDNKNGKEMLNKLTTPLK